MASQGTQTHVSPFLTLPSEIRLRIYQFVFAGNNVTVRPSKKITRSFIFSHTENARHQILLTCRLCHSEGRGFFYSSTTWNIQSSDILFQFISNAMSTNDTAFVKQIQLADVDDLFFLPDDLLPSLKTVAVAPIKPYCGCGDCVEETSTTQLLWTWEEFLTGLSDAQVLAYVNGLVRVRADLSSPTIAEWLEGPRAFQTLFDLTVVWSGRNFLSKMVCSAILAGWWCSFEANPTHNIELHG
jgi:hypothetical protein